jgi:hypothetical protein
LSFVVLLLVLIGISFIPGVSAGLISGLASMFAAGLGGALFVIKLNADLAGPALEAKHKEDVFKRQQMSIKRSIDNLVSAKSEYDAMLDFIDKSDYLKKNE